MKRVAIISIDGGGIRGIIPGTILQFVEEKIQEKTGNPQARLVDYIDFVAGTSTGGILGCGMLMPDPVLPNKPKYSMADLVDFYFANGGKIFSKPFGHKIRSVFGLRDERYPNEALKNTLNKYLGDAYLSELILPSLFTAYDIESRSAFFFKWGKACDDISHDFFLRDVAYATAAAPTYFEAALITSRFGSKYPLIDGGVFANNPAMCAYAEVRKCKFDFVERPTSKDMLMISLGTGNVKEPFPYERAKNFGLIQWIRPLIDIMMSGNSETVSHQLKWLFDAGGNPGGFIRIEPELHQADPALDNASKANMNALRDAAIKYVKENPDRINDIVDKLIENREE